MRDNDENIKKNFNIVCITPDPIEIFSILGCLITGDLMQQRALMAGS